MKCVGIDVGKKTDHSAIVDIKGVELSEIKNIEQADRLPLEMPYGEQIEIFGKVADKADLVLIDCGGPGWPVIDALRSDHKNVWSVAITGGKNINVSEEHQSINVPKRSLVENLAIHFEKDMLTCPPHLHSLKEEMRKFSYRMTPAGNLKMEAAEGHDDIVMAAALALLGFRIRELVR